MQTQTNTSDYDDWLDLTDSRSRVLEQGAEVTPTPDINAAFDQVAALFEAYPEPPPSTKNEKMTSAKKHGKRGHAKKK